MNTHESHLDSSQGTFDFMSGGAIVTALPPAGVLVAKDPSRSDMTDEELMRRSHDAHLQEAGFEPGVVCRRVFNH
jgi:hypothetical protein